MSIASDDGNVLGTWQGRPSKTHQDRQAAQNRERVSDAQHRIEWMQKHKPATSKDWEAYRRR